MHYPLESDVTISTAFSKFVILPVLVVVNMTGISAIASKSPPILPG
jgi:hypothetical protein